VIGKPTQLETEDRQHDEKSLNPSVTEAQGGCPLTVNLDGMADPFKRGFGQRAIARNLLDVQRKPVGHKAGVP
jgi:hypothetical protein